MKLRFGALFVFLILSACTIDIGSGSQLAGQRCFQESDCTDGLTCSERVCVPLLGSSSGRDMGTSDTDQPDVGPNVDVGTTPDMLPPGPDGGLCRDGDRRCASAAAYEICVGGIAIDVVPCSDNEFCDGGFCVDGGPDCRDSDGDGYGPGCRAGLDCDDSNPNINPGVRENCNTAADDNCNGVRNENCNPDGCCLGGCGDDEFCSTQCACQPYDPFVCEFQNQPCIDQGEFENGFACFDFSGGDQPRCWGICDIDAPDPDATCPEAGTVCAFDAGDGQAGICMSTCGGTDPSGVVGGCGEPGLGCLNIEVGVADGICTPTNPDNERGDQCDQDLFFDCDEGLVCLQGFQGGNRGRCREACRPFFWDNGTDCDTGHCLPFSADFGVCFNDNNSTEGESCGPPQSACNEDAVGCYDAGGGGNGNQSCLRLCRLDEGDLDCNSGTSGTSCNQFDMQQTELGVCF